MRLLVTRPEPDALKLAGRLQTLGHESTVEPLLSVDFEAGEAVDIAEVQAVIATSRNGLRALKFQRAHKIAAELPLFAVGQSTAREARNLGFKLIVAGAGTAEQLGPQIASMCDPQAGFLLHLAGDRLAFDLAGELQSLGFRILQPVVYRMVAATEFSVDVLEQITLGEIDGVLLMSPRTAEVYVRLIEKHSLAERARHLVHYCLSPAIARKLVRLGPLRVETAAQPSLEEMLALLA